MSTICCQVPNRSAPWRKGTVNDGPSIAARTWLDPLSSPPPLMVPVVAVPGREPLEHRVQVRDRARLELDRRYRRGRPDHEDRRDSRGNTRLGHGRRDGTGDVVGVTLSRGLDVAREGLHHSGSTSEGQEIAKAILAARGESPAAFARRGIPHGLGWASCSAGSHPAGICPRCAVYWPSAASIMTSLGATPDFTTDC